jgi:hypothetical protein
MYVFGNNTFDMHRCPQSTEDKRSSWRLILTQGTRPLLLPIHLTPTPPHAAVVAARRPPASFAAAARRRTPPPSCRRTPPHAAARRLTPPHTAVLAARRRRCRRTPPHASVVRRTPPSLPHAAAARIRRSPHATAVAEARDEGRGERLPHPPIFYPNDHCQRFYRSQSFGCCHLRRCG